MYDNWKNKDNPDKGQPFDGARWQKTNSHLKLLKNLGVTSNVNNKELKADDVAKHAVHSYLHRVTPKLLLQPTSRIVYPLKYVARYVVQTVVFVHERVSGSNKFSTCPFQYDSGMEFHELIWS